MLIPCKSFVTDQDRLVYISANDSVQINSPLHPNNYTNGIDVTWVIQTEEDRKIHISFIDFDTQSGYDFLMAGDGNDTSLNQFFTWSGSREAPDLLSSGNQMWLRFTTNGSVTRNGFLLTASSVPSTGKLLKCTYKSFSDCSSTLAPSWY